MESPHLNECDLCFFTFDHCCCLNWLSHFACFHTDTILCMSFFIVYCRWAPLSLCLCLFLSVSQLPYVLRLVSSLFFFLPFSISLSHSLFIPPASPAQLVNTKACILLLVFAFDLSCFLTLPPRRNKKRKLRNTNTHTHTNTYTQK